jgi:type IV pilus biogenesis protein CpaD/CtpE
MPPLRPLALLLPLLLAQTACDQLDPYTREGAWRPNNANDANLRAMVAVPADLAASEPASPADGTLAAAALNRLRHDQVRPLPDSGAAEFQTPAPPAPPATPPPPSASNN